MGVAFRILMFLLNNSKMVTWRRRGYKSPFFCRAEIAPVISGRSPTSQMSQLLFLSGPLGHRGVRPSQICKKDPFVLCRLRQIMQQLERSVREGRIDSTSMLTSEDNVAAVLRARLKESATGTIQDDRQALASFMSKMFVVLWNSPKQEVENLLEQVEATSLAGHVGVDEMQVQFPSIEVSPLALSDEQRGRLGEFPLATNQSGAWWEENLDMRRIWSDSSTLGRNNVS